MYFCTSFPNEFIFIFRFFFLVSINLKFVWTFLFLLSFYGGTLSAHGILCKLLVLLWNYHFISALLLMKVCVFYSFLLQDFFSLHILRVLFKFPRCCGSSNNIFLFEVIIVIIVNMSISFESTRLANIWYPVANWFSLMRPFSTTSAQNLAISTQLTCIWFHLDFLGRIDKSATLFVIVYLLIVRVICPFYIVADVLRGVILNCDQIRWHLLLMVRMS